MDDYTVKVIRIGETPLVGTDLRIVRATQVTILVGKHGPFTKEFYPPQNTQDDINAWKLQQQQHVQAIGG